LARKRKPERKVFVKPKEQSETRFSYALARKRKPERNVFVKPKEQSETCFGYALARNFILRPEKLVG